MRRESVGEGWLHSLFLAAAVVMLAALSSPGVAAVLRVKAGAPGPSTGASWEQAFASVTSALEAAQPGDELWVAKGAYPGQVALKYGVSLYGGFAGTEALRGARDPRGNETILDGQGQGTVVTVGAEITRSTVLDGFTIRNGAAPSDWFGGGLRCEGSPLIVNNVFTANTGNYGAAAACLKNGAPAFLRNFFRDNGTQPQAGTPEGATGGLFLQTNAAIVRDNVFSGNWGVALDVQASVASVIAGNTIVRNHGRGVVLSMGSSSGNSPASISNNIVAYNDRGMFVVWSASETGYAYAGLTNNDVYGNTDGDFDERTALVSPVGIQGNLSVDPRLAPDGYHLLADSPCIDRGTDAPVVVAEVDIDETPRIQGRHADIGADETPVTSAVPVRLTIRVRPTGNDGNDGATWDTAKRTVTAALDAIDPAIGGEIWVAAGTYAEHIRLVDNAVLLGGFAGTETASAQRDWRKNLSVLDGGGTGSVVVSSDARAILDGFTVRNGGGGTPYTPSAAILVYGASSSANAATIQNCTVQDSQGGLYCNRASPDISHNVFRNNTKTGGIVGIDSAPIIRNNVFFANSSLSGGGAIDLGGSPAGSYVTLNTIAANTGTTSALRFSGYSTCSVSDNIIAFNSGGVEIAPAIWSEPRLAVNDVYGNTGGNYIRMPDPTGTNGNLSVDPSFADRARGNLHIQPTSPCRDAGGTTGPIEWFRGVDIDGQARVQGRMPDIGADESDGTLWTAPSLPVVRVRPDGDDAQDGSSWAAARKTVASALDLARSLGGAEVWAAEGTYRETLSLPVNAYLYGGFAGQETRREDRDPAAHPTVLSGAGSTAPVVEVLAGEQLEAIDGFTIRDGKTGVSCRQSSPLIRNNTITRNDVAVSMEDASPVIERNLVTANASGGISGERGAPYLHANRVLNNMGTGVSLTDCRGARVADNVLSGNAGGIYVTFSPVEIVNNTIAGNGGPGVEYGNALAYASPIVNNIITGNATGIKMPDSSQPSDDAFLVLRCNDVFGNEMADYRGKDHTGLDGNIRVDPLLADPRSGNLHIQPGSPCRDAGDNTAVRAGDTDLDGQARIHGSRVDIGADESDGTAWTPAPVPILRVRPDGDDSRDGSTWAQAKRTIQEAITSLASSGRSGDIWVAAGTYPEHLRLLGSFALYGGFAGSETTRDQRDPTAHPTVIDGAMSGVPIQLVGPGAVLDGFHVVHSPTSGISGGGRITIARNVITGIAGIGIQVSGRGVVIDDNTIEAPDAVSCYYATDARVTRNRVRATNYDGISIGDGGYVANNTVSGPRFGIQAGTASVIVNNTVASCAFGLNARDDCTVVNNIAAYNTTVGINAGSALAAVRNNCVFGNAADYSGIPDPTGTDGNIRMDPLFVDRVAGDLHIRPESPCRDAGDDAFVTPGETDIDGQPRLWGAHVDIGADEIMPGSGTLANAKRALAIAAGLSPRADADGALDIAAGTSAGRIDILDALRLLKGAVSPNP